MRLRDGHVIETQAGEQELNELGNQKHGHHKGSADFTVT